MDAEYTITGQKDVLDLAATGAPVRSIEVTYKTTRHGVVGSVIIPQADESAENIHSAVQARANVAESVYGD